MKIIKTLVKDILATQGYSLVKNEVPKPVVFMEFDTKLMKKVGEDPLDILKFFKTNQYSSIRIWDNFSEFLKESTNLEEAISISESLPHYANVLFVP